MIYSQSNPWEQINRNLDFIDCYKRTWNTFWNGKKYNDDFNLLLYNKNLFKSNDINLYVESLSDGTYKLKANLDLAKIKDESWPRQSEFTLTESDIDDIIDFCEDHALPESGTELSFSKISEMNKEFSKSSEDLTVEY